MFNSKKLFQASVVYQAVGMNPYLEHSQLKSWITILRYTISGYQQPESMTTNNRFLNGFIHSIIIQILILKKHD